ncbi:MAG: carboxy-S-adenosyl-L-methionine synthase CmoA [Pseudomonadota bacterium]
MSKDRVYSEARPQIVDFAFDEQVASVFQDMIRRSVPGYELVVPMTGLLAARALRDAPIPRAYDLGCSLGATTLAMLHALESLDGTPEGLEIIAVDNAAPMLEAARSNLTDPRVTFLEADIRHLDLEPCAVITLNWVLQFLPPEERLDLLTRFRDSLTSEGLLLLSEKVRTGDPAREAFNLAAHEDFKRANGYSELEISQKRASLEAVMRTDELDTHLKRLEEAGFRDVQVWFQCLNWASIAARV